VPGGGHEPRYAHHPRCFGLSHYPVCRSIRFDHMTWTTLAELVTMTAGISLTSTTRCACDPGQLKSWHDKDILKSEPECPLLAQSGHSFLHRICPLSGVKRTCAGHRRMSAYDPKWTKAPCVLTIVSEAVTVMVGRVEFSAATHAD
jgi:hypothetical protein